MEAVKYFRFSESLPSLPAAPFLRRNIRLSNSDAGSSVRILLHQPPAHGDIQHMKRRIAGDGVGGIGNLFVMGQQSVGIHRMSASARIAFKRSRKDRRFSFGSSQFLQQFLRVAVVVVLHVCGFLMSRL